MWAIIKSFKISIHRTKGQLPEGSQQSRLSCELHFIFWDGARNGLWNSHWCSPGLETKTIKLSGLGKRLFLLLCNILPTQPRTRFDQMSKTWWPGRGVSTSSHGETEVHVLERNSVGPRWNYLSTVSPPCSLCCTSPEPTGDRTPPGKERGPAPQCS